LLILRTVSPEKKYDNVTWQHRQVDNVEIAVVDYHFIFNGLQSDGIKYIQ